MCSTMLVKVLREQARQSLFVSQLFPNFIPASSESFPSKCAIFDIETKTVITWGEIFISLLHHAIAYFLAFFSEILNEIFCVIFGSVGFRRKLEKDTFVFSFVSRIEAQAENESKKGTTQ